MKDQKKEKESIFEPYDGEYVGNIWGWRNSYIALGFLLFMFALAALNYDPAKADQWDAEPVKIMPDSTHRTKIK